MPPEADARLRAREVLRRLHWPVARRLGVHAWGDERSRLRGPGIEYAEVREYQLGEDARTIDWNLTARSDQVFVRESNPDRGLDVWIVMDASRSLDWGTAGCLKREAAHEVATAATMLLSRHGSRVGSILFDTALRGVLPPTAGRAGRLRMLSRIESAGSESRDPGPTDLEGALRRAGALIRRPSLVLVISDFIAGPGWQRALRSLSLRHEVLAIRIADPTESQIPSIGVVTFEDPETGAQLEVDTSSPALRERFRAAAAAEERRIASDLRRAGAAIFDLTTAEPVLTQLVTFLRRRQLERRRTLGPAPA